VKRISRSWLAILVAALFVLAACGQKSGVSLSAGAGGGSGSDDFGIDGTGASGDGTGASADGTATGTGGTGGTGSGTSTGSGSTATGSGSGSTRTTARVGTGSGTGTSAAGADRTGIDDKAKVITIGIHAPVTGAAPIEQKTFDAGKDVYWKWLNERGGLFGGYQVKVEFEDDTFDPVTARRKCAKLVEEKKVFLLVGGAGADQITACANYANQKGVPYISAGVNEEGLRGLRTYFAASETYSQQSPQLAQMLKAKVPNLKKIGLAVLDSKSFADARVSAINAFKSSGYEIVADIKVPKNTDAQLGRSIAGDLKKAGAEIVFALLSPTIFLYIAQGGASDAYLPTYFGPGVTNGLNTVATAGCPSVNGSLFFSPFPQLDAIESMDPNYDDAYNKHVTANNSSQRPDDIGIALWGLNKALHQMFMAVPDAASLSRQSFMAGLQTGKEFKTGVYPTTKYSADNRFGADTVHLLQAVCAGQPRFVTLNRFAKSF
jgi:branched-chain amino acid transport system substrate-binding protein